VSGGALDFGAYDALTFDCYGTIVDWESGIIAAIDALLGDAKGAVSDDELLAAFGRLESAAEQGTFRAYRAVLTEVATGLLSLVGLPPDPERAAAFAGSVPAWPPFPDSADALRSLATRFRLAIVSNVDDDLFAGTAARLGVDFDEVVTAQQVRSYKPARAHFDEALRRLDLPRERVLHVAQSLYHDIAPARQLGLACVWVNRRAGKDGGGATPAASARPDVEVPDLATLAALSAAR
jgi:2-haloacid dehalogenase